MRDDARRELSDLVNDGLIALKRVGRMRGLTHIELAKMIGASQTDSLEKALITKLADCKEAELEKIYNEQKAAKVGQ